MNMKLFTSRMPENVAVAERVGLYNDFFFNAVKFSQASEATEM